MRNFFSLPALVAMSTMATLCSVDVAAQCDCKEALNRHSGVHQHADELKWKYLTDLGPGVSVPKLTKQVAKWIPVYEDSWNNTDCCLGVWKTASFTTTQERTGNVELQIGGEGEYTGTIGVEAAGKVWGVVDGKVNTTHTVRLQVNGHYKKAWEEKETFTISTTEPIYIPPTSSKDFKKEQYVLYAAGEASFYEGRLMCRLISNPRTVSFFECGKEKVTSFAENSFRFRSRETPAKIEDNHCGTELERMEDCLRKQIKPGDAQNSKPEKKVECVNGRHTVTIGDVNVRDDDTCVDSDSEDGNSSGNDDADSPMRSVLN